MTDANTLCAAGKDRLEVALIYALPTAVWSRTLSLARGATVHDALVAGQFFDEWPGIRPEAVQVGIYGRRCSLQHKVGHRDRIEVYRPLVYDPMESRRRRALHRQRIRAQKDVPRQ